MRIRVTYTSRSVSINPQWHVHIRFGISKPGFLARRTFAHRQLHHSAVPTTEGNKKSISQRFTSSDPQRPTLLSLSTRDTTTTIKFPMPTTVEWILLKISGIISMQKSMKTKKGYYEKSLLPVVR